MNTFATHTNSFGILTHSLSLLLLCSLQMDAFFSGEDKAATVKKAGGGTAAKATTTATTTATVTSSAPAVATAVALPTVVEEVEPVVLTAAAAPGAYMSGTIADVEGTTHPNITLTVNHTVKHFLTHSLYPSFHTSRIYLCYHRLPTYTLCSLSLFLSRYG